MCSRWRGTCGRGSSEGRAIPVPPDSHGSRASTSVTERPVLSRSALPGRHGGRRGGPRDPGSRTRRGVPVPLPHCAWGAATGRSRPPPGSARAVPQAWGQPLPPLGRPSRCEHTWPLMSGTRGGDPNWWRSASCSVLPRAGPHRPPHSARGRSTRPVTSCFSRLSRRHISLTLPATFRGRNSTRADYEYQHSNLYAISGTWGPGGRVPGAPPSACFPASHGLSPASPLSSPRGARSLRGPGLVFPLCHPSTSRRARHSACFETNDEKQRVGFAGSKGGFRRIVPALFTRRGRAGFPRGRASRAESGRVPPPCRVQVCPHLSFLKARFVAGGCPGGLPVRPLSNAAPRFLNSTLKSIVLPWRTHRRSIALTRAGRRDLQAPLQD